ncbi:unnamed protein product [Rhizopus microsporus]
MSAKDYSYSQRPTLRRIIWISYARLITFFIPDVLLHYIAGLNTSGLRIAWRKRWHYFHYFYFQQLAYAFG